MKYPRIAFITVAVSLLFASCQKQDDTPVQPEKVATSIVSPYEAEVVHKGDTLHIEADISYISKLHGYVLHIVNKKNNEILFTTEEHEHNDHFSVREQWVNTLSEPTSLMLQITTEITHDGDTSMQQIAFESQP